MTILFCDNGLSPKEVDPMFAEESQTAHSLGFAIGLISFEAMQEANYKMATRRIKASDTKVTALYRGWMLKPPMYQRLYETLLQKNIQLINTPEEYTVCHYLPNNYEIIQHLTPLTTFRKIQTDFKLEDFQKEIEVFGDKPIIVKDYVKSQKYYWEEACYIPRASDKEKLASVVQRFLDLQGSDLNEGLVFREYIALKELSSHPLSGMPLAKEYRIFIKNGQIMSVYPYWEGADYTDHQPNLEPFEKIIPQIPSKFFTMDIAQKKDGAWIIVELGDGQVAGLPEHADLAEFYTQLNG